MFNVVLKWFFLSILDRLFFLICLVSNPFVCLTVDKNGNLPKLFEWWQTPDSDMFGRYGDHDFAEENKDKLSTFWGRWFVATKWSYRNTGQGFSTFVCGIECEEKDAIKLSSKETDSFTNVVKACYRSNQKPFVFDCKGNVKWFFNKNYCFRWRLGWKIGFGESRGFDLPAQIVQSITPFKKVD